ncbi:hypothetical protein [Heliothis virescens ascovirus 3h]|uniref:Uncharacterized protein n=1 Tax=Heliothis virescens ascovirus 3h TaxID=1268039 RepID=A0A386JAG0_9VIRU|nr:hypothetical protein [Heliothis virescens ascovirus 3h]
MLEHNVENLPPISAYGVLNRTYRQFSGSIVDTGCDGRLQLKCCVKLHTHDREHCKLGEILVVDTGEVVVPSATPPIVVNVEGSKCCTMNDGGVTCYKGIARILFEYAPVNVYYSTIESRWCISSHTKLDADRSLWSTDETLPRIGVVFREVTGGDKLLKQLSPRFIYRFGVVTPNACRRIAMHGDVSRVYLMSVEEAKINVDLNNNCNLDDVSIIGGATQELQRLQHLQPPVVNDDVCLHEFVTNLKYPFTNGYGAYVVEKGIPRMQIHFVNSEYSALSKLVLGSQSPYNAYVLNYGSAENQLRLRELYPEHVKRFNEYDATLRDIVRDLVKHISGGVEIDLNKKLVRFVERDLREFPLVNPARDLEGIVMRIVCKSYPKSDLNALLRTRRRHRSRFGNEWIGN